MIDNRTGHVLAPYASDPGQSRGRVYKPSASPTRSEFQRDRDRLIHSTAFRRLQHKTQVFLHHEGQHFRTRLTHTLEVSQIARSIARALRLNEDLAEAVALAHDLGHTPFGHAGERVMAEKMARFGGFDHNIQALRVVTLIENRYAEHDGLNLTWETLEGILKHNGPVTAAHEWQDIGEALAATPASQDLQPDGYASLEAQVAAIADDIAYNAHDIDDASRAGLLAISDLLDVPLVGPIAAEVRDMWPDLDRGIENVIAETAERLIAIAPGDADAVRAAGQPLVGFSEDAAIAEKALKEFLFKKVYRHPKVMGPVTVSQDLVGRLFDHYLETGDMPGRWGMGFGAARDERQKARVVCDFIAGMTDPFAIDEYTRLFDERPDFR